MHKINIRPQKRTRGFVLFWETRGVYGRGKNTPSCFGVIDMSYEAYTVIAREILM